MQFDRRTKWLSAFLSFGLTLAQDPGPAWARSSYPGEVLGRIADALATPLDITLAGRQLY